MTAIKVPGHLNCALGDQDVREIPFWSILNMPLVLKEIASYICAGVKTY